MTMTSNLLNLSLDEIIQQSKKGEKKQSNVRRGRGKNSVQLDRNKTFLKNSNLSLSLSSRLSGGRAGFKKSSGEIRRNSTFPSRLRSLPENQRISVHKRLTLSGNNPRQPPRPPFFVQSRMIPRSRNLRTKNADEATPVRITNGAIVKGLRSDQLLLKKLKEHKSSNLRAKMERLHSLQVKRLQMEELSVRRPVRPGASKVSLNIDRGLTVRIANEAVKRTKSTSRPKRPFIPLASPPSTSSSSEDDYPIARHRRRSSEGNAKEYSTAPSLLRLGVERPPPPKPHRQILDPQIQKEIAVLQGFFEAKTGGPGPGIKGFKMVPCKTRNTLNDRFTMERNILD